MKFGSVFGHKHVRILPIVPQFSLKNYITCISIHIFEISHLNKIIRDIMPKDYMAMSSFFALLFIRCKSFCLNPNSDPAKMRESVLQVFTFWPKIGSFYDHFLFYTC